MSRVMLLLVLPVVALAVVVTLVGGSARDQNVPEQPLEASVDEIVDVTPKFLREPVRVTGSAVPVDGERFVLRGRRAAIVVRPEPGARVDRFEEGAEVTVFGVVENFDRLQASELHRLLATGRYPALSDAPTGLEAPFVSADRVER